MKPERIECHNIDITGGGNPLSAVGVSQSSEDPAAHGCYWSTVPTGGKGPELSFRCLINLKKCIFEKKKVLDSLFICFCKLIYSFLKKVNSRSLINVIHLYQR